MYKSQRVSADGLIFKPSYVFCIWWSIFPPLALDSDDKHMLSCLSDLSTPSHSGDRMFSSTKFRLKQHHTYVSFYQCSNTGKLHASSAFLFENKLPQNQTRTDRQIKQKAQSEGNGICHFYSDWCCQYCASKKKNNYETSYLLARYFYGFSHELLNQLALCFLWTWYIKKQIWFINQDIQKDKENNYWTVLRFWLSLHHN